MAKLGYVGLGIMGSRIAKRLMDAGHTVIGHNRTQSKAQWLIDAGMKWADTPREVADTADITFSMVTDAHAVEAITQGEDGIIAGLRSGDIYVDMSTMSPAYSRELASQVALKRAFMLDVPVSGSVITLEQGKLSLMVGGPEDVYEKILPILLNIGPKVTYVGANGLAVAMKIATNLSLAVQMLALSEGVLLAEKSGIPREKALEVLLHSVIASPMITYRGPFILKQPVEAWFNCAMMQKDMRLALDMGHDLNVPLPTTTVTNDMLTTARQMGFEPLDFAALFNALARQAGLEG